MFEDYPGGDPPFSYRRTRERGTDEPKKRNERKVALASKELWARDLDDPRGHPLRPLNWRTDKFGNPLLDADTFTAWTAWKAKQK